MGDRLTNAATRYVNLCAVERDLRKRRGKCECEHQMTPAQMDAADRGDETWKRHPDGGAWADHECWKKVDNGTQEWPCWEPYGEVSDRGWCDTCTERQRLHDELAVVVRRRVGAWAALRAAVRAVEVGRG